MRKTIFDGETLEYIEHVLETSINDAIIAYENWDKEKILDLGEKINLPAAASL